MVESADFTGDGKSSFGPRTGIAAGRQGCKVLY